MELKAPGWHDDIFQIFFSVQVFCSCLNSCTTWDVEELVQDFSHLHVTPKSHQSPKTKRVQADLTRPATEIRKGRATVYLWFVYNACLLLSHWYIVYIWACKCICFIKWNMYIITCTYIYIFTYLIWPPQKGVLLGKSSQNGYVKISCFRIFISLGFTSKSPDFIIQVGGLGFIGAALSISASRVVQSFFYWLCLGGIVFFFF